MGLKFLSPVTISDSICANKVQVVTCFIGNAAGLTGTTCTIPANACNAACLGGNLANTYAPIANPSFTTSAKITANNPYLNLMTDSAGTIASPKNRKIIWSKYTGAEAGSIDLRDQQFDSNTTPMVFSTTHGDGTIYQDMVICEGTVTINGTLTAGCYIGSGAGLTGTASSLTVGCATNAGSANNSTCLNGQLASYYQPASNAITTSNISSQSVNYATTAGSAATVNSQCFCWSNQSNSPDYVWGTCANGNNWLAATSQLNVKYATTAGSAPANGGTANVAHTITGCYIAGGSELPSYFGGAVGKLQMLCTPSWGWSDTFWMSGYGGGDVKGSNQLVFSKTYDKAGWRRQDYDSSTWGGLIEFITTSNIGSQTVNCVSTPSGTYKHLGAWGVARLGEGAILVNTAYCADTAGNANALGGVAPSGYWATSGSWKPASLASATRQIGIASPDGGEFGLAYMGAQTYPYADGWFYQNEGQYRVVDECSVKSASVNYANSAGSAPANGGTSTYSTYQWATTHPGSYYVYNCWSGARWCLLSNHGSPTAVGYADSAGSAPANGGTSSYVTINYNNDSNSTYQVLWGSSTSVYGTAGVYINPYYDYLYATDVIANSDCRLKQNIEPITNALSTVLQLNGVCYNLCSHPNEPKEIGLIAQEVEKVLPAVVSCSTPTDDEKKFGIEDQKLGLKYEKLTAVLIEAIKEQQKQIEELKAEINNLKNNKF